MELLALGAHEPPTQRRIVNWGTLPYYLGSSLVTMTSYSGNDGDLLRHIEPWTIHVDNINIGLLLGSIDHRMSPGKFNRGAFVFGSMLDLMTSPPTCSTMTIWCQVQLSSSIDINNHIHGFITPPRVMLFFSFQASVQCPLLVVARAGT